MSSQKILWCVDISTANLDRIIYRGWMLELFLYSLVRKGGVKEEDICVTFYVSNLKDPFFSTYYQNIFSLFPQVKVALDLDIGFSPMYHTMDRGAEGYCAINKSSALISVYREAYHVGYDMIALLDMDCYMFGKAAWDRYPTETTLTTYPGMDAYRSCKHTSGLEGQEPFTDVFKDIWGNPWEGINLIDLMRSIRVPESNIEKIKAGSYNIFIHKDDFTEEVVTGFHYFTIAIKSLIAAAGHPFVWQAEMVAYPLALAAYGVDYKISEEVEINDCPYHRDVIPEGTFCTYAFDGFSQSSGSKWNKLRYMESTPFLDVSTIEGGLKLSNSDAERAFYEYCKEISIKHNIKREV